MFPLSKSEKRFIQKLKEISESEKIIDLTDEENQEMMDILELLCDRGVLHDINADNANWYAVTGDFSVFESWVKDQERKEKRMTRREWSIAIISAIIGATIGLLPTIIPYVVDYFRS